MSLVKRKIKDVAADLGMQPKEIMEIIGRYFEKPKSNAQNMTDEQMNVVFDYITLNRQIGSIAEVFAVAPAPKKAEEPKPVEAPVAAPAAPVAAKPEKKPEERKRERNRKRREAHERVSGTGQRDHRAGGKGLQSRPEKAAGKPIPSGIHENRRGG